MVSRRADENEGTKRYVEKKDNMKYRAIGQEEKTRENTVEVTALQPKRFKENHFSKRKDESRQKQTQ